MLDEVPLVCALDGGLKIAPTPALPSEDPVVELDPLEETELLGVGAPLCGCIGLVGLVLGQMVSPLCLRIFSSRRYLALLLK